MYTVCHKFILFVTYVCREEHNYENFKMDDVHYSESDVQMIKNPAYEGVRFA